MKRNRKVVRVAEPKAPLPKNVSWKSLKSDSMDQLFESLVLALVTFAFGTGALAAVGFIAARASSGIETTLAIAGACSLLLAVRFTDDAFQAYRELVALDERENLRRELMARVPVRVEETRLPVPFHDWYIH